jgi:hypothetical protein
LWCAPFGPSFPRIGEVESALYAVEPVLDGLDLAAVTRQVAVHDSIDDRWADMSRPAVLEKRSTKLGDDGSDRSRPC